MSRVLTEIEKLIDQGEVTEASTKLREYIEQQPDAAEAYLLLAKIAKVVGNLELARQFLEKAMRLAPGVPKLLVGRGNLMVRLGHVEEGVKCFERALAVDSNNPEAHAALGRYYADKFSFPQARHHLELAAAANPTVEAKSLLGHVLIELGQCAEAEKIFQECLELGPNHGDALVQMGSLHLRRSDFARAMDYYRRAHQVLPDHPEPLWNIAYICLNTCEPISSCKDWLELSPHVLSRMVFALNYQSDLGKDLIAAAHRAWGLRQTQDNPRVELCDERSRALGRTLRLGFVSGDFCQHPVGRFAALLFSHFARDQFELYVYDSRSPADKVTHQLQSLVPNWRNISTCNDDDAARLIARDQVDVLIDLSGHTLRNRLPVFARRPAPLQVTLFAYPNTTGLEAIDYRITDPFADPPGLTDHLYTEKSIRLSRTAWVYLPPDSSSRARPLELSRGDRCVFGCLNNPQKISPACIRLWSTLLQTLPEACLMLLTLNESHAQKLRRSFVDQGAAPTQLWLAPKADLAGYLEYHSKIDLMLDPFPYNGGVTTCDSLWMGVPVLTLVGDSYVSRQGVSILSNVGLHEFIAETPESFLEKAQAWVAAREKLEKLRAEIRPRLQQSPLMDYASHVAELGEAFQRLRRESALKAG